MDASAIEEQNPSIQTNEVQPAQIVTQDDKDKVEDDPEIADV